MANASGKNQKQNNKFETQCTTADAGNSSPHATNAIPAVANANVALANAQKERESPTERRAALQQWNTAKPDTAVKINSDKKGPGAVEPIRAITDTCPRNNRAATDATERARTGIGIFTSQIRPEYRRLSLPFHVSSVPHRMSTFRPEIPTAISAFYRLFCPSRKTYEKLNGLAAKNSQLVNSNYEHTRTPLRCRHASPHRARASKSGRPRPRSSVLLGSARLATNGSSGRQRCFLSAGGYHHHIGLNTWESLGGSPPPPGTTGLYHTAILYPTRAALAQTLHRVLAAKIPLDGAADHGASEAIYLRDPDENGVELTWDRPQEQWGRTEDGQLVMFTRRLDLRGLLNEASPELGPGPQDL